MVTWLMDDSLRQLPTLDEAPPSGWLSLQPPFANGGPWPDQWLLPRARQLPVGFCRHGVLAGVEIRPLARALSLHDLPRLSKPRLIISTV